MRVNRKDIFWLSPLHEPLDKVCSIFALIKFMCEENLFRSSIISLHIFRIYSGHALYKVTQSNLHFVESHLSSRRQLWVIWRLSYTCGSCSTFSSFAYRQWAWRGICADPHLLSIGSASHNAKLHTKSKISSWLVGKLVPVDLRIVHIMITSVVVVMHLQYRAILNVINI